MLELNHLHLQKVSSAYSKPWCHAILWPKAALFPLYLPLSLMRCQVLPSLHQERKDCYSMVCFRNIFHFAWLSKDNSPSSRAHSAPSPLQNRDKIP